MTEREGILQSTIAMSGVNMLAVRGMPSTTTELLVGLAGVWRLEPPLTLDELEAALVAASERGHVEKQGDLWLSTSWQFVATRQRDGDGWDGWNYKPLPERHKTAIREVI